MEEKKKKLFVNFIQKYINLKLKDWENINKMVKKMFKFLKIKFLKVKKVRLRYLT